MPSCPTAASHSHPRKQARLVPSHSIGQTDGIVAFFYSLNTSESTSPNYIPDLLQKIKTERLAYVNTGTD